MLPQMVPYPTRFRAPKAHVDRMPVAQLCRQISPRTSRAVEMQQRLQELTIAHLPGRSGKGMFRCVDRRLQLLPDLVGDDFCALGFGSSQASTTNFSETRAFSIVGLIFPSSTDTCLNNS